MKKLQQFGQITQSEDSAGATAGQTQPECEFVAFIFILNVVEFEC